MKYIATISLLFLSITLFAQVNDADAFFAGTYDKFVIRSHKISEITVDNEINESKSAKYVLQFDDSGRLLRQTVFDSSGKRLHEYQFTLNSHGDPIERKTVSDEMGTTYSTYFDKTYVGAQLVRETTSELPMLTTYGYDGRGRKIQSSIFYTQDTVSVLRQLSTYRYNATGQLLEIEEKAADFYNPSATAQHSGNTTYIYDAAGYITDVIREGKANYVYSYNSAGLLKEKIIKMPEEFSHIRMVEKYSYRFRK